MIVDLDTNGDGRREPCVLTAGSDAGLFLHTIAGRRLVSFPDDGHPFLCSDARDIDGDGIDEVLTWNEEELWIYKADVPGRNPDNYPHRQPWYNDSNYRAQLSLPEDLEQ